MVVLLDIAHLHRVLWVVSLLRLSAGSALTRASHNRGACGEVWLGSCAARSLALVQRRAPASAYTWMRPPHLRAQDYRIIGRHIPLLYGDWVDC